MTYKTVARILIKNFGPPADVEVQSHGPQQIIHLHEQVNVSFPPIFVRGNRMPVIGIDLRVERKKDERTIMDIVNTVYDMMPQYHEFWKLREREAVSGILLP